ncbi:MAG: PBP1A family penicillin-binding protein [Actinomycetota bacterium]|nr:PBP1A family penicillin-binding protein [Actinomycetota bacterium]
MLRRRETEARPRRPRRIRKLRLLTLLLVLATLGLASFTFGLVTAIASEIPLLDPRYVKDVNGYVYASDGRTVLAVLRGRESRVLIERDEMSPWIRKAVVAVEDRRFFEHRGVDVRGIARALWADVRNRDIVQGGSTITQQYVKNVYVKNQRSIGRKLREAALAWQLEQKWDKERILTAYLNTIYFGNGAYGVQQAAQTYFGHGARRLTVAEAALLAGIPADPARFDPATRPQAARERRTLVLRRLLEEGEIERAEYEAADAADMPNPGDVRLPGTRGPAQHFVNYVKQQLAGRYGASKVYGGGLRVRTTIDLRLQRIAREAIASQLTSPEGPTAALVAIDPRSGKVLTMVGGNDFNKSQFNLAVQSTRQPGSAFKPFVLATALEAGVAPATTFVSEPTFISLGGPVWEVHNYEEQYLGTIDLETATIHSDNAVFAQLTRLVGPSSIVRTAHRLGIASRLRSYFAIGLGAEAVNPLEMARAFSAFANGGLRVDGSALGNRPRVIRSVHDEHDRLVDENEPRTTRVLRPDTAAILNSILQRVVEQGTGRAAALEDRRPVAGKTGTTEEYGDAWFVGYTPQLVAAVWVGYPDRLTPMTTEFHGEPVAGGTYPALIWKAFMERALARRPVLEFPEPPSLYAEPRRVVWRDGGLRLDNGLCRETAEIMYLVGYGPGEIAACKPNEVDVPRVVGATLDEAKERLAEQPLEPVFAFKPAEPKQRVDIVLAQYPAGGRKASANDEVTLVVAKPLHGVVPRVVGLTLRDARTRLSLRRLEPVVLRFGDGRPGRIVSQAPPPGVAAQPRMRVRLVVGRG